MLQRVFKTGVPQDIRGGHNHFIELIKKLLIRVETEIEFPVGVTLLGIYTMDK
jgi:hypothetical protein